MRENKRVIIIFEGRDSAGKGGTIKRIVQRLNPNNFRVVAKGKPTPEEERMDYFSRWKPDLPASGEMVLFDRSWYTRAGVESVMGFATESQVRAFYEDVYWFEKRLMDDDVIVLKYWLSITQDEQETRFHARLNNPMKRWKLSEMDLQSRNRYDAYTIAKERMFKEPTNQNWRIVNANDKRKGRLDAIRDILRTIPYQFKAIEPSSLEPLEVHDTCHRRIEFPNLRIN